MNRPSWLVRFMGSTQTLCLLGPVCLAVIAGWYWGGFSWWQALLALAFIRRMLVAGAQVSIYEEWVAAWVAMGAPPNAEAPPPVSDRRNLQDMLKALNAAFVLAWLSKAAAFIQLHQRTIVRPDIYLYWLHCLMVPVVAYLGWKAVRLVYEVSRFKKQRQAVQQQRKEEEEAVSWVLGPAAFSPSRREAQERLPAYCARLIQQD